MKSVSTHRPKKYQNGLTLIELIIGIVVLGIAAVAITATLSRTNVLNTDPLLRVQSLALAESYLEEVLGRPFYQPDDNPIIDPPNDPDSYTPDLCPDDNIDYSGSRQSWSVCDYDGFNLLRPDRSSPPDFGELTDNYSLLIEVTPDSASVWKDTGSLSPDNCILRIDVSVTPLSGPATKLTGYRTSYWEGCL